MKLLPPLLALLSLLAGCGGGGPRTVQAVGGLFEAAQFRVNAGAGLGVARSPDYCVEGQTVYVVWEDDRNDPGDDGDIFFNVSHDGGRTWLPADIRLDTDAPGAKDSDNPAICCAGESVYVAWGDWRNGDRDVYFNHSTDGGITWLADDVRLDTDAPGSALSAGIHVCCDGPNVYVLWGDDRDFHRIESVRMNASTDGGATWLADDVRVDTSDDISEGAALGCAGSTVYAAWRDEGANPGIHFSVSRDAGRTWGNETVLSSPQVKPPAMCYDGANVYVLWADLFELDIYFNSSLDGGQTWQAAQRRLTTDPPGDARIYGRSLGCDGLDVYAAWVDARLGPDHVFFNRSFDGGLTWEASDIRVDSDLAQPNAPSVCGEGLDVYVAWADARFDPDQGIFVNTSLDGGLSWQADDVRLDTEFPNVAEPDDHRALCHAGTVYVLWEQGGNIHLNRTRP